ncbi:MAG: PLP-dependent transferase [Deltaproteobacteria bacterium]|nr:PLP-dependent transferase [Deltaproteobacteria bacterium]
MRLDTLAIHAGQRPDVATGAVTTPVYQTATYVQAAPGEHKGWAYSRGENPTRDALQENLAALEGVPYGLTFSSGCAAAATIMHSFEVGDHIICGDDGYGGTYRLFVEVFTRSGLTFSFVDLTAEGALEAAIRPETKAVWLETPTNPMLKVTDLAAVAEISKAKGLLTICDNTFMTPVFQRPFEFGFDVVVHSTTKYLNGHSDVIGGFVCTPDEERFERLRRLQISIGATQGPWDSWLILRGIKTLPIRMRVHDSNGRAMASFLNEHKSVEKVIYPGLASHPQHKIAARQMSGFGGMISVVVKGGLEGSTKFIKALKVFALAESLGGVESLVQHPALMTQASVAPERRAKLGIEDGLVRLSVGIEDIDDLKEDLDQALA